MGIGVFEEEVSIFTYLRLSVWRTVPVVAEFAGNLTNKTENFRG